MDVRKCDKCGKIYTANNNGKSIIWDRKYGVSLTDCDGNSTKVYDLCDDCITDFYRWLKGEENDQV